MTRLLVPFRYGIKTYDLDVLNYSNMFVLTGPKIITSALGSKPFYFYKLTLDGTKTLSYNPGSDLATDISFVLIHHWSSGAMDV